MPKAKLNLKEFAALRTSPATQAHLRKVGKSVAQELGPGWATTVVGKTLDKRGRSRGVVSTASNTAKRKAMKNPGDAAAVLSRHVPLAEGRKPRRRR